MQGVAEAAAAAMYETDRLARTMGMEISAVGPGTATAEMTVGSDHVNGHGICHGGVIFTLADTALAYASNSHGGTVVASGASIEFLRPVRPGDELSAVALETHAVGRSGFYEVRVSDAQGTAIALFSGRTRRLADDRDDTG